MEGLEQLAQLVAEGGSRISVMPGGGVSEDNAATVARVTGVERLAAASCRLLWQGAGFPAHRSCPTCMHRDNKLTPVRTPY
jgi:copper homeostasis protein CutC